MKLHINEGLDSNLEFQKTIKRDVRKIAAVDPETTTYEDLKQLDLSVPYFSKAIAHCEEKGLSIEDCIDYVIEQSRQWLDWVQSEYNQKAEYDKKVDSLIPVLNSFLKSNYVILDYDKNDEGAKWTIEAPTNATHDDCIEFADSIVDAVNGKYYMTTRGGSWSNWHILANGVELKAGWKLHTKNWEVELNYRYSNL